MNKKFRFLEKNIKGDKKKGDNYMKRGNMP